MFNTFYDDVTTICRKQGFILEEFAKTGDNKEYKLYKIIINPNSTTRTICFSSGIHGREISGPLGVVAFLKNYIFQNHDPRIVILPLLNPYGFFKDTRRDYQDRNLNKEFFKKPQPIEIQKICSAINNEKIDLFVTLHEDDEKKGFYIYKYSSKNGPFCEIIDYLSIKGKICTDKLIYKNKANHGIIEHPRHDGSFSEWMFSKGVPYSTCIEIPDNIKLKSRINIVSDIIDYIIRLPL